MEVTAAINSMLGTDLADPTNEIKARVQVAMLRKSLDAQQSEADAILKLLSGVGQNLDIRA